MDSERVAISTALELWGDGWLSDREVVAWTDRAILASANPGPALIDLSMRGPADFSRNPPYGFAIARPLTESDRFALQASKLDLDSDQATREFASWWIRTVYHKLNNEGGWEAEWDEWRDLPEVELARTLDEIWGYDSPIYSEDGVEHLKHLREKLPSMLPGCRARAAEIWAAISTVADGQAGRARP